MGYWMLKCDLVSTIKNKNIQEVTALVIGSRPGDHPNPKDIATACHEGHYRAVYARRAVAKDNRSFNLTGQRRILVEVILRITNDAHADCQHTSA
jgi:hypothetical protein